MDVILGSISLTIFSSAEFILGKIKWYFLFWSCLNAAMDFYQIYIKNLISAVKWSQFWFIKAVLQGSFAHLL